MTNPAGIWEKVLEFITNFDRMFPNFKEICLKAQMPFFMVALVILVYALVTKLTGAGRTGGHFKATYGVLVITIMVCLCNPLGKLADGMMKDVGRQMVGATDTQKTVEEKQDALVSYLVNDIPNQTADAGEDDRGALYYMFHWGDAVEKGVEELVPSFLALEIKAACGLLIICSKLASVVQWGFWLLQQFLVLFSKIFLPTFIAMLAVPTLAPNAVKYILGLLGFMAWPIGFALVNVGTIALIDGVFTHLRNSAETLDATTYVWAIIVSYSVPIWIIVGTFVAPMAIQKMVAAAGNAASSMLGQVGAAAVGGAALVATGGLSAAAPKAAGSDTAPAGGSSGATGEGGGGSTDAGRNPQTLAARGVAGSGGGSFPAEPVPMTGGTGSSGGSGGGGTSMAQAVIAGAAATAAQPFHALAAESGSSPGTGPTMAERVQRSQAMGRSAPVATPAMNPSSAAAREAVALRRARNS